MRRIDKSNADHLKIKEMLIEDLILRNTDINVILNVYIYADY